MENKKCLEGSTEPLRKKVSGYFFRILRKSKERESYRKVKKGRGITPTRPGLYASFGIGIPFKTFAFSVSSFTFIWIWCRII